MKKKRTAIKPDPKSPAPKTIAEAKEQIAEVFAGCRWDWNERRRYIAMKTGRSAALDALTPDEVRTVHAAMVAGRMILVEEKS